MVKRHCDGVIQTLIGDRSGGKLHCVRSGCGQSWQSNAPTPICRNQTRPQPALKCRGVLSDGVMVCVACRNVWGLEDQAPHCLSILSGEGDALLGSHGLLADTGPAIPRILSEAQHTFLSRNAEYGGNYRRMGALILALFPEGGVPPVRTPEEGNRLNLLIDCLGKLQRYAHAFHKGGHKDSAHDLIVYAAMLEEMTK